MKTLISLVNDEKPKVVIMPESIIKKNDSLAKNSFKKFNVEIKFHDGSDIKRITVLIDKPAKN